MGGQRHAPAALPPAKRHRTHCIGGWGGPMAVWTDVVPVVICELDSEREGLWQIPWSGGVPAVLTVAQLVKEYRTFYDRMLMARTNCRAFQNETVPVSRHTRFLEVCLEGTIPTYPPHNGVKRGESSDFCTNLCELFRGFLCAFAKLRRATISFVVSLRLSVRMEQLGPHWTDFHEI